MTTDRVLHIVHNQDPPVGASPHWVPPAMDLVLPSQDALDRFADRARELARTSVLSLGEAMVRLGEQLRTAYAAAEAPPVPEEPRARALHLVQNRGTGPARPLATERRRGR